MTGPAADLAARYRAVRAATERLAAPLSPEDQTPQSMPDASPVKWHRAHTTWFFETFVLEKAIPGYEPLDPAYRVLFNSYYNSVGEQYHRPARGQITRPGVAAVAGYRQQVDAEILNLLDRDDLSEELARVVEVGLHHEQQHQELLLTDVKHLLSRNPLHPVYRERPREAAQSASALRWHPFEGGLLEVGHAGPGFAFDNEGPRHPVFVKPFLLASRPVSNAEYVEFIEDDGYARAEFWLSDGWAAVKERGWRAPAYWEKRDGQWYLFTLAGLRALCPDEPVTHLSAYEADAYASWVDARLPTEFEWEVAAAGRRVDGHFVESERFHPAAADPEAPDPRLPRQLFGDVWEWTASAYAPYPGYRAPTGALGEYNGKFMANQLVLRGGSCATPSSHIRSTYRNFFYPDARWQFSGLRLVRDPERPPA